MRLLNGKIYVQETYVLITSQGPQLKPDEDRNIEIGISRATLEEAMPVLESIVIKPKV